MKIDDILIATNDKEQIAKAFAHSFLPDQSALKKEFERPFPNRSPDTEEAADANIPAMNLYHKLGFLNIVPKTCR